MTKLTKFLRNPRVFVQDAKVVRRALLARHRAFAFVDKPSRITVGVRRDQEELFLRFQEDLGRTVGLVDMTYSRRRKLALLLDDLHLLTGYLHDLAKRGGFRVRIDRREGTYDVGGATLIGVDNCLSARRTFNLAIEDPKTRVRTSIDFQVWERRDDNLVGPANHRVARRVDVITAERHGLFVPGRVVPIMDLLAHPMAHEVRFPVDVVYTWVNHRDEGWRKLWHDTVGSEPEDESGDTRGIARYLNRDELRYSLRSLAAHAPWARNIHIVSNCDPPDWLDQDHPNIRWVDHREVLPEEVLPVFNSHAIESRLQHIPGLADNFVYFNDDMFLTRYAPASYFFEASGLSRSFMERHGSVNGEPRSESPDYLNAARNGRRLLEDAFSRTVTQLHLHSPFALRRDVLLEMEQRFRQPIEKTTAGRFRAITDISTVSFLYHHYAYLTGKGIYAGSDAVLLKPQTPRYERRLQQILRGQRVPTTLCLNDGRGSESHRNWNEHVVEFLNCYFPTACEYERSTSAADDPC